MEKLRAWSNVTLRGKLLLLNGIVVAALVLLSVQAWRASSVLEHAQESQVRLADALHESKQADMLHDALHAGVLASLLVGQVPGLSHEEVQTQVSGDVSSLNAALDTISRASLAPELAEQAARNETLAEEYGAAALAMVLSATERRETAISELPAFREQFQRVLVALDEQGEALGQALQDARALAARDANAARQMLLWTCVLTIIAASGFVALVTEAVRRRLRALGAVAQAIAGGDLTRRVGVTTNDEIGALGMAVDQMASGLHEMIERMRTDAQRAAFGKHLAEALDMADREQQVAKVVARAMAAISRDHPMELLVSDSSKAQMERAAEHPLVGAPGCGVGSPYDCVAVRRGNVVTFENSESLNACVHLHNRPCGAVSAVCVPVTFMGRAMGVLHSTGPVQAPLGSAQAQQLGTLGTQIGMRIGTVRAFEKTQIQAATDGLTGLANRRTVEQRMRALATEGVAFAFIMCDLDHFKILNDTYGHATGDSALRTFADVLRTSVRESDMPARWGGEEFALILAQSTATVAVEFVERLRKRLASAIPMSKVPSFTSSFGVADSTMSPRVEHIVQLADVALYQAKASGRDRACIAEASGGVDMAAVRHAEQTGAGTDVEALLAAEA